MMSSIYNTAIYVGVTSDLERRVYEHRNKHYPNSFTAKYNCIKLVYFQDFFRIEDAIAEEKRIKGGSRGQKVKMITDRNPDWKDLWETLTF